MTEAPVSFELPIEGATTNYKQNEVGLTVLFAPHISEQDQRKMGARNYRRVIQRTGRKVGIRGMMYDDFMKKDITDQFLFLRQYIPDGSSPVDIGPWYEDVKAIETPVGKFNWPSVPNEVVVYKLDAQGNKVPMDSMLGVPYTMDEHGAQTPITRDPPSPGTGDCSCGRGGDWGHEFGCPEAESE